MSKDILYKMIDLLPEKDCETIYKVLIKFIPEDVPEPDEIVAILAADADIKENSTVAHEDINWD